MLSMDALKEIHVCFERCQKCYPTVALPFEPYSQRLTEILAAGHAAHTTGGPGGIPAGDYQACSECTSLLRQMCHEDLYLATACVRGDRIAWEYFADQYVPQLKRFASQACRDYGEGEDLAHELIVLLLGDSHPGAQPANPSGDPKPTTEPSRGKLQSYCGRGSLSAWLRAAVAHAAIDRFRRAGRQVSLDELEEKAAALPGAPDPAPGYAAEERLDAHWGPVLAESVRREITRLSARDRLVLGLYYLEGVPLKAIGLRFGVHEATASRWLDRVRRQICKHVERELRKTHGLHARDLESLWRWAAESADPIFESSLKAVSKGRQIQKKLQGGIL